MFLSVIGPAYNESENLGQFIGEVREVIGTLPQVERYEIIIIDDHSEDNSFEVVKSYNDKNIKSFRLSRRSGSYTALRAGFRLAKGDAVLCLSTDGQDNPQALPEMLRKWEDGNKVVWGVRTKREEPFLYKLCAQLFYRILLLLTERPVNINIANADFCLVDRLVVNAVNQFNEVYTSLYGLIIWVGYRQDYVIYDRRQRRSGKTKWTFVTLLEFAKDWIIAFSAKPVKLISWVGLGLLLSALAWGAHLAWNDFYCGNAVSYTYPLILLVGGIQVLMTGILGEYLFRSLDESRQRPLYFIESSTEES